MVLIQGMLNRHLPLKLSPIPIFSLFHLTGKAGTGKTLLALAAALAAA